MKTIILIGMATLGLLIQNVAANGQQTSFNYQFSNDTTLVYASKVAGVKTGPVLAVDSYYFNPETVVPAAKKSVEQEIEESNLVVDNTMAIVVSLTTPVVKSTALTIYEDVQITQASGLDTYQPLDFDVINNSSKDTIDGQNKCSLKVENIKL